VSRSTPTPAAAATELERAVTDLGLVGALINGRTGERYLDDPAYYPLFESAEAPFTSRHEDSPSSRHTRTALDLFGALRQVPATADDPRPSRPAAYRMDEAARVQVAGGNALRLFGDRVPLS
jgi:hypothetical protein